MGFPFLAFMAAFGYANIARVIAVIGFVGTIVTAYLAITADYEAQVNSLIGNIGSATIGQYSADLWLWASLAGAPGAFGVLVTALGTRVLIILSTWAISALT